jgi:HSF-type DNA-binding
MDTNHRHGSNCLNNCVIVESYTRSELPAGQDDKAHTRFSHRGLAPGKTAKNHARHFVVHAYRDHAQEEDPSGARNAETFATTLFPMRLHEVLNDVESDGLEQIISWAPHGRCFMIHRPQDFVTKVLPK